MRTVIIANWNHTCKFERPQKSTCDTVMLREPIFWSVFGGISQKQKARLWSHLGWIDDVHLGCPPFNLCRFVLLKYIDLIVFRFDSGFTSQKLCDQVLTCYDLGFCKRVGGRQLVMLISVSTGTVTFYFFPRFCPTTVLNVDSSALRTFLQQLRGEYTLQRTSNHCFTFTPHISCTTAIDLCTTLRCLMLCSNKEWQYNLRSCFSCLSINVVKASIAFTLSPTIKSHCFLLIYKSLFHIDF